MGRTTTTGGKGKHHGITWADCGSHTYNHRKPPLTEGRACLGLRTAVLDSLYCSLPERVRWLIPNQHGCRAVGSAWQGKTGPVGGAGAGLKLGAGQRRGGPGKRSSPLVKVRQIPGRRERGSSVPTGRTRCAPGSGGAGWGGPRIEIRRRRVGAFWNSGPQCPGTNTRVWVNLATENWAAPRLGTKGIPRSGERPEVRATGWHGSGEPSGLKQPNAENAAPAGCSAFEQSGRFASFPVWAPWREREE